MKALVVGLLSLILTASAGCGANSAADIDVADVPPGDSSMDAAQDVDVDALETDALDAFSDADIANPNLCAECGHDEDCGAGLRCHEVSEDYSSLCMPECLNGLCPDPARQECTDVGEGLNLCVMSLAGCGIFIDYRNCHDDPTYCGDDGWGMRCTTCDDLHVCVETDWGEHCQPFTPYEVSECQVADAAPVCPVGWSIVDAACVPDDCDQVAWSGGTCSTDNFTIHMTQADTSRPDFHDYCAADEMLWTLNNGFNPAPSFCLDVPDLDAWRGPYFTRDGGITWTKSTLDPDVHLLTGAYEPPLMLRSDAHPDFVFLMAPALISDDGGATFRRLLSVPETVVDATISPDGGTLFILGYNSSDPVVRGYSIPSGQLSHQVSDIGSPRFLGAVWSIRALSETVVLVSGRWGKSGDDGFRAVVRVDADTFQVAMAGPELEGVAATAHFSRGVAGAPIVLAVDVGKVGVQYYERTNFSGNWGKRDWDFSLGRLLVLDVYANRLVRVERRGDYQTASRSLDGGYTWGLLDDWTGEEVKFYKAVLNGDWWCSADMSSCDFWTTSYDAGVVNVGEPSFLAYRPGGGCDYLPAMGGLPLVEPVPGSWIGNPMMSGYYPTPLAPVSVLALGGGRAVVIMDEHDTMPIMSSEVIFR